MPGTQTVTRSRMYTFDTIVVVLQGPVHTKIHNLVTLKLVSELYKCDYVFMWMKEHDTDIYDVLDVDETEQRRMISDVEFVKQHTYFYNPEMTMKSFLNNCVAKDTKLPMCSLSGHFDYVVFDNLTTEAKRHVPNSALKKDDYECSMERIYHTLVPSSHVNGYLNIFREVNNSEDVMVFFIRRPSDVEVFKRRLPDVPETVRRFVLFHWDVSCEDRENAKETLRTLSPPCIFVVHETHKRVLEYFCLRYTKKIVTVGPMHEWMIRCLGKDTQRFETRMTSTKNTNNHDNHNATTNKGTDIDIARASSEPIKTTLKE